jgi:hypothetical protein
MSDRSVEVIKTEMAAERQLLDDDLKRLKSDLRGLAVFVAAGAVVIAFVTWRVGKRQGATTVWKLVK